MKRKISIVFLLVCLITSSLYTDTYSASEVYINYGMPSPTAGFKISNEYNFEPDSRKQELAIRFMTDSLELWTNSGAGANVYKANSGSGSMYIGNVSDSWYGLYQKKSSIFGNSYNIKLNYRTIKADAKTLLAFIQSVATHELGHALSLADNPPGTEPSIMSYSRDRNVMGLPQPIDISRVKAFYR